MILTDSARRVAERLSTIARLELLLAQLEVKEKARTFARAIVLGLVAALLLFFAFAVAVATITAALATVLAPWLALLIVFVALAGLGTLAGLAARSAVRAAVPPLPERAIEEARRTVDQLKERNGGHGRL